MRHYKYMILCLLLSMAFSTEAVAKHVKAPQMYMFGFSTSFTDSVVYITDIQELKGVWIESKSKFLLSRDNYSYQLKNYMDEQLQQPNRLCMVFFSTSKKGVEKKLAKLKKKYITKANGAYDVRYVSVSDFRFEPVEEPS